MKKCPQCDLNYIMDDEEVCKVCKPQQNAINSNPAIPKMDLRGRTELIAGDKVYFSRIAEAVNSVFGTDAENYYQSLFTPGIFHSLGLGNYKAWFPLAPSVGNSDYKNILSQDGTIMTEEFLTTVIRYPTDNYRITFYGERHTDGSKYYHFVGIFKFGGLEGGIRKWIRIQDRIKIYANKYKTGEHRS